MFQNDQAFDCRPIFDGTAYVLRYFDLDHASCTDAQVKHLCAAANTSPLDGEKACAKGHPGSCVDYLCRRLNASSLTAFCHAHAEPQAHYLKFGIHRNIPTHVGSKVLKILLMHKDEWPLLRFWVLYHAHVIGLSNLIVLDESNEPEPRKFLRRMQKTGLTVLRTNRGFDKILEEMDFVFKSLRWSADYLIKLDTDEYLVRDGSPPSVDMQEITKAIDGLELAGHRAQFHESVAHVPDENAAVDQCWPPATRFYREGFAKSFLPAPTFRSSDLGFHNSNCEGEFNSEAKVKMPLTVLHLQLVCYDSWVSAAMKAVESHRYIVPNDTAAERITKLKALQPRSYKESCTINSCHKIYISWRHLETPEENRKDFQQLSGAHRDQSFTFDGFNHLILSLSEVCHGLGI